MFLFVLVFFGTATLSTAQSGDGLDILNNDTAIAVIVVGGIFPVGLCAIWMWFCCKLCSIEKESKELIKHNDRVLQQRLARARMQRARQAEVRNTRTAIQNSLLETGVESDTGPVDNDNDDWFFDLHTLMKPNQMNNNTNTTVTDDPPPFDSLVPFEQQSPSYTSASHPPFSQQQRMLNTFQNIPRPEIAVPNTSSDTELMETTNEELQQLTAAGTERRTERGEETGVVSSEEESSHDHQIRINLPSDNQHQNGMTDEQTDGDRHVDRMISPIFGNSDYTSTQQSGHHHDHSRGYQSNPSYLHPQSNNDSSGEDESSSEDSSDDGSSYSSSSSVNIDEMINKHLRNMPKIGIAQTGNTPLTQVESNSTQYFQRFDQLSRVPIHPSRRNPLSSNIPYEHPLSLSQSAYR